MFGNNSETRKERCGGITAIFLQKAKENECKMIVIDPYILIRLVVKIEIGYHSPWHDAALVGGVLPGID